MKLNKLLSTLFIVFFFFSILSCKKDQPAISDTEDLNNFIFEVMKNQSWYLWYTHVPDLDPKSYSNSDDFLEALKYKELDKWSYLTTVAEHDAYFVDATYYGHGFAYKFDENQKMRVSYVFKDSPMAQAGAKRSWEFLSINNISVADIKAQNLFSTIFGPSEAGYSNHFKMVTDKQDTLEIDVAKSEVKENTVLYSSVFEQNGIKTGYLVFNSFIEPSVDELNTAFAEFKAQNISNLIVDLRYNGGGLMSVAQNLASLIGGTKTTDKLFVSYTHNDTKKDKNTSMNFVRLGNEVNIDRLVFITTNNTASASEAVINGLKPYMKVVLVGSTTHGKPVGMYTFQHNDYLLVPICFQLTNSLGDGDYFSGIPVDAERIDDLTKDWGNTDESCLKESLFYTENGYFSNQPPVKSKAIQYPMPLKGIQNEIGAL